METFCSVSRMIVAIASSSDTLERAQTVGFTIPYMVFQFQALLSDKSEAASWEEWEAGVKISRKEVYGMMVKAAMFAIS